MKLFFWALIGLLAVAVSLWSPLMAAAGEAVHRPLDVGVFIQDYKWAEYGDDGGRMLEETGNLFGMSLDYASRREKIGWRTGGRFFLGEVDYDGRTWSDIPVTTDVFYFGFRGYADAAPVYRLDMGLGLTPFLGLGAELWLRDLEDTRTPDGAAVNGAREWWGCVYGRLGLGLDYPVAEDMVVFMEAGAKLPIYARNEAEFRLDGDPTVGLEPEMDFSGFGCVGFRWKAWGIRLSYDSLRFDRSDTESAGHYALYQPDSESDVTTLEIFWSPEIRPKRSTDADSPLP